MIHLILIQYCCMRSLLRISLYNAVPCFEDMFCSFLGPFVHAGLIAGPVALPQRCSGPALSYSGQVEAGGT